MPSFTALFTGIRFRGDLRVRLAERGASLVEYAMLVGLIAVVCLGALQFFSDENEGLIQGSADEIQIATSGS